ncbi:dihydrofolate reductase [Paraglaciecola Antarctic GD virus 1]|nr:dihydrofolate reductase [Paraglaciecola Antarctic GD virus 1]
MIKLSFACGVNGEFGLNGGLPWGRMFKNDMDAFKAFTTNCVLVMGRKTFESLPTKLRGLKHIVLTSKTGGVYTQSEQTPDLLYNIDDVPKYLKYLDATLEQDVCVIGGAKLIEETMSICDMMLNTIVVKNGGEPMMCDVTVATDHPSFKRIEDAPAYSVKFRKYGEYMVYVYTAEFSDILED